MRRICVVIALVGLGLVRHAAPAAADVASQHVFLGDYPHARENGWSQEVQGVAHDASHWFFTQRDRLLRFPVDFDLNAGIDRLSPPASVLSVPIPPYLASRGYDHLGDIDQRSNYVFAPVESMTGRNVPGIAAFRANDLTLVGYTPVGQRSAPWVAVNADGLLYTSNSDLPTEGFYRYRVDFAALSAFAGTPVSFLALVDHSPVSTAVRSVQGGTFTPSGDIYLSNGNANDDMDGGIKLFSATGTLLAKSSNGSGSFNYPYNPGFDTYEEPEGIDYWDRGAYPWSPGFEGQLHAIMLDNDYSVDDLYFKHFEVRYPYPAAQASAWGWQLLFDTADGVANAVTITQGPSSFVVSDSATIVSPGVGCSAVRGNVHQVTCATRGIANHLANLRDGNDYLTVSGTTRVVARGGPGDDALRGGSGDDWLSGELGNDTLRGGAGPDAMFGGSGADTVTYETHAAGVVVDADGVADDGASGEGDNVAADVENLTGGWANDVLTGNNAPNIVRGGDGNDVLRGELGDDTLDGGPGADVLWGGPGTDLADYSSRLAAVYVSLDELASDGAYGEGDNVRSDVENITGGYGNDVLRGNVAANVLRGLGGGDTLDGREGNDVLDGGAGPDSISGGAGRDLADYQFRSEALSIDLDDVADDGASGEYDNVRSDVEDVRGGSGADLIVGSGAANHLWGGAGNNRLTGLGGDDVLEGGPGADQLRGGPGADWLYGYAGYDMLWGDAGYDRLDGGAGAMDECYPGADGGTTTACEGTSDL
jgi:Ca2+-binding RTX toxin-like protein